MGGCNPPYPNIPGGFLVLLTLFLVTVFLWTALTFAVFPCFTVPLWFLISGQRQAICWLHIQKPLRRDGLT